MFYVMTSVNMMVVFVMAIAFVRCGDPSLSSSHDLKGYGGTEMASVQDWPGFMVTLHSIYNKQSVVCTGTYLGHGVVLTAAHCVLHSEPTGVTQEMSRDQRDTRKKVYKIRYTQELQNGEIVEKTITSNSGFSYVTHENYDSLILNTSLFDDIAMVFVNFGDHGEPRAHADLPRPYYISSDDISGTVTVYGVGRRHNKRYPYYGRIKIAHKYSGFYPSGILKEAAGFIDFSQLKRHVAKNVRERYDEKDTRSSTKFSIDGTGKHKNGDLRQICKGDSGGGAILTHQGHNLVVGVTSASALDLQCRDWHTSKCCHKGELVYVPAYLEWIERKFKDKGLRWPPFGEPDSSPTDSSKTESTSSSESSADTTVKDSTAGSRFGRWLNGCSSL